MSEGREPFVFRGYIYDFVKKAITTFGVRGVMLRDFICWGGFDQGG